MILAHESSGHFAAAKLLGVRVEVFSLGFGKRLLGFRHGDTDTPTPALPLGGYVKMTGVNAVEMAEERPERREAPADAGEFLRPPALATDDHRGGRTNGVLALAVPADRGLLPAS